MTITQTITNSIVFGNVITADKIINDKPINKHNITVKLLGKTAHSVFLREAVGYFYRSTKPLTKSAKCKEIKGKFTCLTNESIGKIEVTGTSDKLDIIEINSKGVFRNGKIEYKFTKDSHIEIELLNDYKRCLIFDNVTVKVYCDIEDLGGYDSVFQYYI